MKRIKKWGFNMELKRGKKSVVDLVHLDAIQANEQVSDTLSFDSAMTSQAIADSLNTSKLTVTRALSRLTKAGKATTQGKCPRGLLWVKADIKKEPKQKDKPKKVSFCPATMKLTVEE